MKHLSNLLFALVLVVCAFAVSASADVITIPSNATTIADQAFMGDKSVTDVVIGKKVTSIGKEAFANSGLTRIVIPKTVTSIGSNAFYGCDNLRVYVYPGSYAENYCSTNGVKYSRILVTDSGSPSIAKMSVSAMSSLLEKTDVPTPSRVYKSTPSTSAPYAAGQMTTEALNVCLNRLNALRKIGGVPPVSLNETQCDYAQHGAVLMVASAYGHRPPQPSDMPDDFYSKGYTGTSTSNIYAGCEFVSAVDGYMADPGWTNKTMMGHRRWQLNPTMSTVGFGVAYSSSGYPYFTEKVFGDNGYASQSCDYTFISWPSSGNFPISQMYDCNAWTVTLNPGIYNTYVLSDVWVEVIGNGETYRFGSAGNDGYFTIDTNGYGVSNCIIFDPPVYSYSGTYTVRVHNLLNRSLGAFESLEYSVKFF